MKPDLGAATAKFGQNVGGEHSRIGTCHVDVEIFDGAKPVQRIVERDRRTFGNGRVRHGFAPLDFVNEQIPPRSRFPHPLADMGSKAKRMAQVRHVVAVEVDDKNVFWCCAGRKEVVEKEFAEQIRFPASPQTRDDLDLAIPLGVDELLQIAGALNVHGFPQNAVLGKCGNNYNEFPTIFQYVFPVFAALGKNKKNLPW